MSGVVSNLFGNRVFNPSLETISDYCAVGIVESVPMMFCCGVEMVCFVMWFQFYSLYIYTFLHVDSKT